MARIKQHSTVGLQCGKALTLIRQRSTVAPTGLDWGGGLGFRVGTGVGEGLDIDKAAQHCSTHRLRQGGDWGLGWGLGHAQKKTSENMKT